MTFLVKDIRDAITTNGGTPVSWQPIGALRELVTVYGGTPTKYDEIGLLRQAITAKGGTPTKWEFYALVRELLTTLGQSVTSYQPTALMRQLATSSGGGGGPTVLTVFAGAPSGTVIGSFGGSVGSPKLGDRPTMNDTVPAVLYTVSGGNLLVGSDF